MRKIKIVYSINSNFGGVVQLRRFLRAIDFPCEIKIAAFLHHLPYLPRIDWVMDAVYNKVQATAWADYHALFGKRELYQNLNYHAVETLLEAVGDFEPDLVIGDGEYMVTHCADYFKIPFWYVSGQLLSFGVKGKVTREFQKQFSNWREFNKKFKRFPSAERCIIPSPFDDLEEFHSIKNFELCSPYYQPAVQTEERDGGLIVMSDLDRAEKVKKIIKNIGLEVRVSGELDKDYGKRLAECDWVLCGGESAYLADIIYNHVGKLLVVPALEDPENHFNSIICSTNLGTPYLGQLELAGTEAPDMLAPAIDKLTAYSFTTEPKVYLHELIRERFGLN